MDPSQNPPEDSQNRRDDGCNVVFNCENRLDSSQKSAGNLGIYGNVGSSCAKMKKISQSTASRAPVALNWSGGWHHARENRAAGFCYVNDCVLACLHLKNYGRVLYIDLDVHHCDAVEDAFLITDKVAVVSLHHFADGFYPNTGSWDSLGQGNGYGYTLNLPFKAGLTDAQYSKVVKSIFPKLKEFYRPDFLVVQCGADGLAKDPLGTLSLTAEGYKSAMQEILNFDLPTLILGGGGYSAPNTAKLWTEITALTVAEKLCEDLPECDLLEIFEPDYSIKIENSIRKNENSNEDIDLIINEVLEFLECDAQ